MRVRWYTKGELLGLLRDIILRFAPSVRLQDDSVLWFALREALYEAALRTLPIVPEYWVSLQTHQLDVVYRRVELGGGLQALVYRLPVSVIRVREVWVRKDARSMQAVMITPGEFQSYLRNRWTSPRLGARIVWFQWGTPEVAETDPRYRGLWVLPIPEDWQPTVVARYTALDVATDFREGENVQYPLVAELEPIVLNLAVEKALLALGIPEVDAELVWQEMARHVNVAITAMANERLGELREAETVGKVETMPVAQQQ